MLSPVVVVSTVSFTSVTIDLGAMFERNGVRLEQ